MKEAIAEIRRYMAEHDNRKNGRPSFTIELGQGETYSTNAWTIYAHDRYERWSVLAGRERRIWLAQTGPGPEGLKAAEDACKAAGIWKRTAVIGGTTHIPVDVVTAHLTDDTDY
jgi:hypothetical protein